MSKDCLVNSVEFPFIPTDAYTLLGKEGGQKLREVIKHYVASLEWCEGKSEDLLWEARENGQKRIFSTHRRNVFFVGSSKEGKKLAKEFIKEVEKELTESQRIYAKTHGSRLLV